MKKIIVDMYNNQALKGSVVLLVGSNLANVIAYLYHFILGPMLGKADYGELVVFLSIISLLSSTYSFLGMLVMKVVSAEKNTKSAAKEFMGIVTQFQKPVFFVAALLLFIVPLSSYFRIHTLTALLVAPVFILSFLLFLYKSFLQGNLKFLTLGIASILEIFLRLLFAYVLVKMGALSSGPEIGYLAGVLVLWIILRRYVPKVEKSGVGITYSQFVKHGLPIFLSSIATTAFFTVDVLLVRAFFSANESGIYGAAATLGKMVLFSAVPITGVLFPLISRRHTEGREGTSILVLSLAMSGAIGGAFSFVFYLFPEAIVSTLYRSSFVEASPLLFPFSVFMLLLVLNLVLVNYYLPREKYFPVKALAVASLLQVTGVIVYHPTLLSVIYISIGVSLSLLASLLIYFTHENQSFRNFVTKTFRSNSGL